jgi:hypothetical protein
LVGAIADNNETTSSSVNGEPSSSLPSNTDDMEDSSSDNEGSDADNSDYGDVLEEDVEENIRNNNDLFDENDETDPSDEEIGDLFE